MTCRKCQGNNLHFYPENIVRLAKSNMVFVHDYHCRDCGYDERYISTFDKEEMKQKKKNESNLND